MSNVKYEFIFLFKKFALYIFTLTYIYIPGALSIGPTVEELLTQGTRFLAAGQLNDALTYYSQVVEKDPDNHMGFYRRGTAYLSLGNLRLALTDFEKAVVLNTGFIPALKQRANVYLKLGKLHEAKVDFGVLALADKEASEKDNLISILDKDLIEAQKLVDTGMFRDALKLLDTIVESITHSEHIREMRAKCLLEIGEVQKGIQEMRYAVHLTNDNRAGLLKLSVLMYDKGFATQALSEISECLRLDQDDSACKSQYSKIKKTAKAIKNAQDAQEASQYQDCIKHAGTLSQLNPNNNEYIIQSDILLCQCHSQGKTDNGVKYCEKIVQMFPDNLEYQCDLAEAHLNVDNFDEAIKTYQGVLEEDRRHQRAKSGLNKAQKLLKVSQRRDYYKILGVSKSASKKEIMKAYRKLAAKWHPDRFDGDEKKAAEKKFLDISAAKEVLSNDEKRQQYDSGNDPLDPSQQQQHQGPFGHPFGGFTFSNMHPFEGSHFEFRFG